MSDPLIIFDCDGVLVDSEPITMTVLAEMVQELGGTLTPQEALGRFRGKRIASCLEEIAGDLNHPLPSGFERSFRLECEKRFSGNLTATPYVSDFIDALTCNYCVASSAPRKKIEHVLGIAGLLDRFKGQIFSSYEVNSWKPSPVLFETAADHFKVAPDACVVIEDSQVGVQAARSAGMTAVAYCPHADSPVFNETDVVTIRSMARLPAFFDQWQRRRAELEPAKSILAEPPSASPM